MRLWASLKHGAGRCLWVELLELVREYEQLNRQVGSSAVSKSPSTFALNAAPLAVRCIGVRAKWGANLVAQAVFVNSVILLVCLGVRLGCLFV
jgi:hypothetical protein